MKAELLIHLLSQVDPDTEVFRSHGDFSREVIDAEITDMCSPDDDHRLWRRCQVSECTNPKQPGVLIT